MPEEKAVSLQLTPFFLKGVALQLVTRPLAKDRVLTSTLPRSMLLLTAIYFVASLAHFSHNAEYIGFYPGMPGWLTREKVYLAWLGVTGLGVVALLFARLAPALALLSLAVYGAFGLDGLAHYTLALCSEHTLMSNITIWSEAITGLILFLTAAVLLARRVMPVPISRYG